MFSHYLLLHFANGPYPKLLSQCQPIPSLVLFPCLFPLQNTNYYYFRSCPCYLPWVSKIPHNLTFPAHQGGLAMQSAEQRQ